MKPIHIVQIDSSAEYALVARGHYGGESMNVEFFNKSDRVDKQRAEVLTLVAGLLEWAREQGIQYEGARVWYAR